MEFDNMVLGIDLGTTNSCIAILRNNKQEVIKNNFGSNITPSCILFRKNQRMFEKPVKECIKSNPKNTVFNIKRIIGRNFDDKEVQNDIKYWPFKVIKDKKSNKPQIEIELNGQIEKFYPEQISAMILGHLQKISNKYLNRKVKKAIIAVPAYFNEKQRKATLNAGEIAGLKVIRLIDEPIAAAIAYGFNDKSIKAKNILVFDLGGGTFDVSILKKEKNNFKILTTNGDSHFGGEDFDQKLVDYCCESIEKKYNLSIYKNNKVINKLKCACEEAKKGLSISKEEYISIEYNEEDIEIPITRNDFEELCSDLFNKIIPIIEKTLKDINLTKKQIDEVIFIGGSSKIPKIQRIVKEYFNGIDFKIIINPEEAVAIGCAIQGTKNYSLKITNPHSIGINTNEDKEKNVTSILIPKNEVLPFEITETFSTSKKNQTQVAFDIYQGENYYSKDNTFIGGFVIKNIRKAKEGEVDFNVNMKLDENGILSIHVIDVEKGNYKQIIIKNIINFNDEEINYFKQRENQFKKEESESEYGNSKYIGKKNTLDEIDINNSIKVLEELDKQILSTRISKASTNIFNKNSKYN